jgi:iron complex outermembrane recepter protein
MEKVMKIFTIRNYIRAVRNTLFTLLFFLLSTFSANAQVNKDTLSASELKGLSLEQLMNVNVTIVSKTPEELFKTPASVYVISSNEIKQSGAANIVQALELAPNLEIGQANSYAWVVTSRGFSNLYANKLLVMIDGRVVYTPLFAGVVWDAQNVLLNDVDHIEVVSGPGGTLWGSNAVNGVINILTKSAKETQGLYISAGGGTFMKDFGAIRYGGKIGSGFFLRLYLQRYDNNGTITAASLDDHDKWGLTQGGFRADWSPTQYNKLTFQGDLYGVLERTLPSNSNLDGQNFMGKWSHDISDNAGFRLRMYFDRTWIHDIPSTVSDQLTTYDIDFQHHFSIGKDNKINWGLGYRLMLDETPTTTMYVGILPVDKTMPLYSAFLQDEINLIDQNLTLTLGSKLEHNVFTGFEIQPSARLAWTPNDQQTIWAAVSRAVRTPSRIDVDYYIPKFIVPPTSPSIAGGPNFVSEKLIAYELGYRIEPISQLSISLAGFYNNYNDLYSIEALPGTLTYEIQNGSEGKSWGAELFADLAISDWWQIRGGYTYFRINLKPKPGHTFDPTSLANDPENQYMLESDINFLKDFNLGITARGVGSLPKPYVPAYLSLDARLAWQLNNNLEFSIVGQNLLKNEHIEFGTAEIPRSIYGKISFSLQ